MDKRLPLRGKPGAKNLTLDLFDHFVVVGLGDADAVDADDDVILPDSGAEGRSARPHRLHEDRLVPGEGQSVAQCILVHQEIPEEKKICRWLRNVDGMLLGECVINGEFCAVVFLFSVRSKCRKWLRREHSQARICVD